MSRGNNYGLKTRDMAKAGLFAAHRAARAGHVSYASARALSDRWQAFAQYCHELGIRRMEQITPQHAVAYGRDIADQVAAGETSPSYGQNLVSAVNTVMHLASRGQWQRVSPTRDCGIKQRSGVREVAPELDRQPVRDAVEELRNAGNDRGSVVLELARNLGLRSKEASLIDASRVVDQARERGAITISDGTKGGRDRVIPVTPDQVNTLEKAAQIQGYARSLVPPNQTWAEWRNNGLRDARETLQRHGIARIHDLRAGYACERYEQLTGQPIPLCSGRVDRETDRAARLKIALELGHNRIEIAASYIGGRAR